MAFITTTKQADGSIKAVTLESTLDAQTILQKKIAQSPYDPSDEEKATLSLVKQHFTLGYVTMYTPRVEFNDLCVIDRMQVDQMAFNTYQPNNGQPATADTMAWRSNAMRPIVRNKCISIAAHATARLIFPKVFAYNENSDQQAEAAQVMRDLIEWASDKADYTHTSLRAVLTALSDPASVVYTEYGEVYREVKRGKENGKYVKEKMLDDTLSGFRDTMIPVDELFIENFYEPDIQKQGWLIWRRVYGYDLARAKYSALYPDKWKYVSPGVQVLYNDANQSFYQVYDTNMRQYDVEEVIYWNRAMDVKLIVVNGVMLTDCDNANPRNDKMYPMVKFGYEMINNRCFYFKSLAFKLMQDANIVNTLYPMIIDGTYLNLMPPMVNVGGEEIGSDVIIPGAVTTLSDPNADLRAIQLSSNLKAGMDTLFKVDESINASSEDPIQSGQDQGGTQTAYEISRLEQNAATVLGLFIKMISHFVKGYGYLRMGDILQYLTIADVTEITDNPKLIYKTFLLNDKQTEGKANSRKIQFDSGLSSEPLSSEEQLAQSYDILSQQGGEDTKTELYKVNPELFRNLSYMLTISPDVLNPMSDDLERAFGLEEYDRAIANPMVDQEAITRELLLGSYPKTKKDPDKYMKKPQDIMAMAANAAQDPAGNPNMPQAGNSPLAAVAGGGSQLPQTMSVGQQ